MYGKTNAGASTGGSNKGMVKLWENASPTSEFGANFVSLALDEGDFVEIRYRLSTSGDIQQIARGKVGSVLQLSMMNQSSDKIWGGWRTATISKTGISFSLSTNISYTSASTASTHIIPVEIYLIKGAA